MTRILTPARRCPAGAVLAGAGAAPHPSARCTAPPPMGGTAWFGLGLVVAGFAVAVACDDGTTPTNTGGQRQPVYADPRYCNQGGDATWKQAALAISEVLVDQAGLITQTTCPYTIASATSQINLATGVRMPQSVPTLGTPYVVVSISDRYSNQAFAYPPTQYMTVQDPDNAGYWFATTTANNVRPGAYPDPNRAVNLWDSVDVTVHGLAFAGTSTARGFRNIEGQITGPSSLSGPTTVVVGSGGGSFSASTDAPASGYTFAWTLDGAPVGSNWDYTVPDNAPGTHYVGVVITRSDGTYDNLRRSVKVVDCGGSIAC